MSVDPEIFAIFQHKVERIPHFAGVTEVRHTIILKDYKKTKFYSYFLLIFKICEFTIPRSIKTVETFSTKT